MVFLLKNMIYSKTSISLNVFLGLTIFLHAQASFPFVIESSGRVDLQLMEKTPAGDLLLAGTFTEDLSYDGQMVFAAGDEDVFLMRLNSQGQLRWMKAFGGVLDDDVSFLLTGEEHFWLAGGFRDEALFDSLELATPDGSRGLFLLELADNGAVLSHRQFDSPGLKSIEALIETTAGELILGGYFEGELTFQDTALQAKGLTDIMLIKFAAAGAVDWVFQAGGLGNNRIECAAAGADSYLLIAGTFDDFLVLDQDTLFANTLDKDIFVAKLNHEGQLLWSRKAGGVFDEEIAAIGVDDQDHIVGVGQLIGVMRLSDDQAIQSQNGNTDFFWFELDPDGLPLQAYAYGGALSERVTDLIFLDNTIWISGIYQGMFTLENKPFDAGGGVGSFIVEWDVQNNELVNSWNYPASTAVFLNQMVLEETQVLAAGSFGGELNIEGQKLDAGNQFYGLLARMDRLSTSLFTPEAVAFQLFPNPFTHHLNLYAPETIETLWIFDSSGRLRWKTNQPHQSMQLDFLEKGAYLVLIQQAKGGFGQRWVIKH